MLCVRLLSQPTSTASLHWRSQTGLLAIMSCPYMSTAYDHSRIVLKDGQVGDYINANRIPGFNKPRRYIAAQGKCVHNTRWLIWGRPQQWRVFDGVQYIAQNTFPRVQMW